MARGILGGMVFGGAVSVAAASAILVVLDPPTKPELTDKAPSSTTAPQAPDQQAASGFADADLVREGTVPQVSAPAPEDVTAAMSAGEDRPVQPEAGEEVGLAAVSQASESAAVDLPQSEPVLPAPQAALPNAPVTEAELSISTEPAQPPAPKVDDPLENVEPDTLAAPDAPTAPEIVEDEPVVTRAATDTGQPNQEIADAPVAPGADAGVQADAGVPTPPTPTEDAVESVEADTPETVEVAEAPDPVTQDVAEAEETAPEAAEAPLAEADVVADVSEAPVAEDTATEAPVEEEIAEAPEESATDEEQIELAQADTRPSIGTPANSIINRSTEQSPLAPASAATPDIAGPPLQVYAAAFDNPGEKPLMSVVLIDEGVDLDSSDAGLKRILEMPFTVSFAVDAALPDAADRMASYRAAGFEVLAMMDLPQGATPQDAAVNLDAALEAMPEAVAVIEGPGTGVQESQDVADLMIETLQTTGHGLVLQAKGLNSAQRNAERLGLPSRLVFRDFDKAGQNARTIRRFLEQAAFRAGQEGSVIMMGRLRAETITALQTWNEHPRADSVAMSPVSAVLLP